MKEVILMVENILNFTKKSILIALQYCFWIENLGMSFIKPLKIL